MHVIDFSHSFLTFRIDTRKKPPQTMSHEPPYSLNNARIQLDCRCQIERKANGRTESFVLGANCKTEQVGVERDIWLQPNADFVPIFSATGFMNLKTYARAGMGVSLYPPDRGAQSDRQTGRIAEVFDDFRVDVVEREAEPLTSPKSIVEAILENQPLVARTQIESERYLATLEYPVKTINANERDMVYQTDTGPVLLPDLAAPSDQLLERFELAFTAFNSPDWIEVLVRVPTPIGESLEVYHYDRPLRLDARNELLRVGD